MSAIASLIHGPKSREAVDAFFASHTFPLVDGPNTTFVWRGHADAVHLRHWVYGLPSHQSLSRIEGTDVWHFTLKLPPARRVKRSPVPFRENSPPDTAGEPIFSAFSPVPLPAKAGPSNSSR